MNKYYEIYQASDDEILKEDKARLDGYLKGRADQVDLDKIEELKNKFQEMFQENISKSS